MMKTSLALVAACTFAAAASAQTPAFLHGQKVLLDKNGVVIPQGGTTTPPPAPLVGGSDDCSTAAVGNPISGTGAFAVTTVGATLSALQQTCGGGCHLDVWFYWTSTVSSPVTLSLCGITGIDTVVAVWNDGATPGTCPTTAVACNDDSCGLQSSVTFTAVSGTSYFLQLGAFGAVTTYSGTFNISTPPPPPINDDCSAPIVISGSGPFPFNNGTATTGTQGQTEALCLFFANTGITKDAWWTWTATQNGTATLTDCGSCIPVGADTKVAIYAGGGCPTAAAVGCNDDGVPACAAGGLNSTVTWPTVCGTTYTIQLGNYPLNTGSFSGTFSITETGTACSTPPVAYCFGDGTSTACPCGNAGIAGNGCASSVNPNGANLSSSGTSALAGDTLVLLGSGMPVSSALYFQGTTQIATIFGDGLRCAGGSVIRLATKANSAGGSSQYPAAGDLSVSAKGLVTLPGTRTYQVWYRNAAAFCTVSTFNLTNGLLVTWN